MDLIDIYRGNTTSLKSVEMTPEEKVRVDLVRDRFVFMSQSKSVLDWKFTLEKQIYEIFEQHLQQGEIWNAPYRFPEIFGAIQRKATDLIDNLPEVKIRARRDGAEEFALATQATVDHTDRMTFAMREKIRVIYDSLMYGTGILFESYFRKTRKVTAIDGDDLLVKKSKNPIEVTLYDGLTSERIDPRDFFIDETATVFYDETGVQGARDCIRRRSYPYSTFLETFKDNPEFKYIENIMPISWGSDPFGRGKIPYEKETQEQKTVQRYVVVLEYWNIEEDMVTLVANGIEIYYGANPFKHKRLPFIPYYNYRRDDSCWGISEIEILAPFVYADEEIVNLMILDSKLGLQPALAVSGDVMWNTEESELEPGAIFTLRGLNGGKIQDAIMPLKFDGVPPEAIQVRQLIEDKRTIATGDDLRALYSNPNQLATQTLTKREVQQKRIKSNIMQNTIESERNRVEMKISNIIQFYAQPYQNIDGDVVYRRIPIEGYDIRQASDEAKPEFKQSYGASGNFSLNTKVLGKVSEIEIEVVDTQLDKELKKDSLDNMMRYLETVVQFGQTQPQILQGMNIMGLFQEIAQEMDLDLDEIFPTPGSEEGEDAIDLELDLVMLGQIPELDPNQDSMKALDRYREFMQTVAYKKAGKPVHNAMQQFISLTSKNVPNSIKQRLGALRRSNPKSSNGQDAMAGAGQPTQQGGGQGVPQISSVSLPEGGQPSPDSNTATIPAPGGMAARHGFSNFQTS